MTDEIQQTRYDRLLRRVGGIIGPGSKVGVALSELFPTIDVEQVPGELLALQGTILGYGAAVIVAGAGVFPKLQLFNPAGSGVLVAVTQMIINSNTGGTFVWTLDNFALTTATTFQRPRDSRFNILVPILAEVRTAADAPLGSIVGRGVLEADVDRTISDRNTIAVLSPGNGLTVAHATAVTSLSVTFLWRERPAEQSELSF